MMLEPGNSQGERKPVSRSSILGCGPAAMAQSNHFAMLLPEYSHWHRVYLRIICNKGRWSRNREIDVYDYCRFTTSADGFAGSAMAP
jgi:nucleoside-specific outer membrane channel protein Tsx